MLLPFLCFSHLTELSRIPFFVLTFIKFMQTVCLPLFGILALIILSTSSAFSSFKFCCFTQIFSQFCMYSLIIPSPVIFSHACLLFSYLSLNPLIFSDPNFVSSFALGDFVYFFFREIAVEYLNCGKVSVCILTWHAVQAKTFFFFMLKIYTQ